MINPPTTLCHFIIPTLQVGPGHHVFVSGAGPIGLMTAMCCKAAGAATVTITAGMPMVIYISVKCQKL